MSDDLRFAAFARRHGLGLEALRELTTLVSQSALADVTRADPSRTSGPTELDRHSDDTFDAPRRARGSVGMVDDRYAILGRLGSGGQGDVYRVHDDKMGRPLAMKVLRVSASAADRARFRAEAALTVGLEHPGIVPIYDQGFTPDGRPWYTMQILEGEDFARIITDDTQPLRRRVDVFLRACEAVGYAHRKGVIHRDLKPSNIMIGAFGEVRVLDWGLARRLSEHPVDLDGPAGPQTGPLVTRYGAVLGTPLYMPPEQIDGRLEALGPPTDVYALGLILGELLTGEPPEKKGLLTLRAQRDADLPPPATGPAPLRALAAEMTRTDPAARPADASVVAETLRTWLDGARKREQAAVLVAEAATIEPTIAALRVEADALDRQAAEVLDALPPYAPVDDKRPGWVLADAAIDRRRAARLAEVTLRETLQSALRLDPDSQPASDALSAHYRARLIAAEAIGDGDRAAEYRTLIEGHDATGNAAWLRGDGRLTLHTDPPGAAVELFRYETRDRRLVAVPVGELGATPIVDLPLAMGSYLLVIRAPGRVEVRYPVCIERRGVWHGTPPGATAPHAIALPPVGALDDDACYVPAGWCALGGDPDAMDGLPRRRLWVDGFAIDRDPVTHGAYIEWLDALVDAGRLGEALRHVPAQAREGGHDVLDYTRDAHGRFTLGAAYGTRPGLDWPVVRVSWRSATAYAAWRSRRDGIARSLPTSWQWEKAARGVDGRAHCWGNAFDPTWACVLNHAPGPPQMAAVGAHPTDVSPYGMRGATGNVRDLCADVYRRLGPPIDDHRPRLEARPGPGEFLVVKGGTHTSTAALCRAASRFGIPADARLMVVGFRLCRPLG